MNCLGTTHANIKNYCFYLLPLVLNYLDVSVFIGVQSYVNQTNWFWNNGTMVNDSVFPASNKSICQQVTWPLTYNDGINLYPKKCETGLAHFVCKTLCKLVAKVDFYIYSC